MVNNNAIVYNIYLVELVIRSCNEMTNQTCTYNISGYNQGDVTCRTLMSVRKRGVVFMRLFKHELLPVSIIICMVDISALNALQEETDTKYLI